MNHTNEVPPEAREQAAGGGANQCDKIVSDVRKYLKFGFNVIPCDYRTKQASIHWKPYQGQRVTEKEIESWFSHQKRNLAIITGKISNIIVLDVDSKKHPEAEAFLKGKQISETLKNITHNGFQYIFRYPNGLEIPTIVGLGGIPGLDVKGDGGYILVYPSMHPEGTRYRWERPKEGDLIKAAPEWLLDAITLHKISREKDDKYDYRQAFSNEIPEGLRNNTLTSLAGKLKASSFSFEEALWILTAVNRTQCKPPLPNDEIEGILKSVYSYGDGVQNESSLSIIKLSERSEPAPTPWILKPIIPDKFPSTFYGDGGLGKSYLGLFIGTLASMGGQSFLGHTFPDTPLKTLYLDFELDESEFTRRAYMISRGLELSKPPESLFYANGNKSLFRLIKEIHSLIKVHGIQFLVLDSLGAASVDPDTVTDVVEIFTKLRNLGIAVLILDHQSKMQSQDNYNTKTPYGSVYKYNLSRSVFQLAGIGREENRISLMLRHKKSNFGGLLGDLIFDISFDEDRVMFLKSKALSPETSDMMIIWEALQEMKSQGMELIQKNLIIHLKGIIGKDKLLTLLDKGKSKYWDVKTKEGKGRSKVYEPKEKFWFSDIYNNSKTRINEGENLEMPPEYMA
ncbi:MAG: bifunctional DNA primase/polymerase [Ignavibacteriales bacterium]